MNEHINNRINLLKEVVSTFGQLYVDKPIAQMEPTTFFEIATAYYGWNHLKDHIQFAKSFQGINIFCVLDEITIQTIISWEEK